MAKSPRNNDPRAERDDSEQGSGTYVEVVGTPRRRQRGTDASAARETAATEAIDASERRDARRESVRPAEIAAEQIRLPSGAVAYVSPAVPRSSRSGGHATRERSPASELHLDAPSWVESSTQERNYPRDAATYKAPRAIREVIPRRIEDERVELERASHPPVEARRSTVESVRPEPSHARVSRELGRDASIPSESTRPRAVIDCIPDETTQARARLSAVQAALVLASQSERPPARTSSVPPGSLAPGRPSGASVLDAKPQMVSDPPAAQRTSWGLVGLVALLCSIISAAAVVALKEAGDAQPVAAARVSDARLQASTARAPVAEALVAPTTHRPTPSVEQLPTVAVSAAQQPASEPAPSVAQDAVLVAPVQAPSAAALQAPAIEPAAPTISAPMAPTPAPHAASAPAARLTTNARGDAPRAAAATSVLAPVEVATLPAALTPGDTKAVLTKLADEERVTQRAEERKAEEERKLPSTSRLKAPSVRIEAGRLAAALKKASQEAVARANEQTAAPAAAPVAPTKPAASDDLPDNPF